LKNCLICNASIAPFIDFGNMPLGNGFLLPEWYDQEYRFHLQMGFCPECTMAQLLDQPDRERMFHENYAFFSGTSRYMALHFKAFSEHVVADYVSGDDPFVVEMGSNDGIMLHNFATAGIRHLGIEPSRNVAQVAIDKGINTVTEFFGAELADGAAFVLEKTGFENKLARADLLITGEGCFDRQTFYGKAPGAALAAAARLGKPALVVCGVSLIKDPRELRRRGILGVIEAGLARSPGAAVEAAVRRELPALLEDWRIRGLED